MARQRPLSALMKPLLFATCALLLLGAFSAPARAQSVTFAGAQTTVPTSGLNSPYGVAVDGAGDVFIADEDNSRVVEVPAGGGAQTTVGTGLNYPTGVAVDRAGDVFVVENYISEVVEVPAGGGAQTTVGSVYLPYGVAVDGAGDVFIADTGNNRVVEVPVGGGAQTTVVSGLNLPYGVAVDRAGDVFIADTFHLSVVEVPAGGGAQTTVVSGLNYPTGVAVDGAGDVFIADGTKVVKVPAGGGAQTTVGTGLNSPTGVAVDGAGDVFIADNGNNRVVEVQSVAVNFGNVNVCPGAQTTPAPCNQTLTLNYNVEVTTTFGTPKVVTQGAPNLDFKLSSGGTCTGTVTGGNSCTVNVTFAPLAPGVRMGAVQLFDSSGNLLVTTMIHGVGQGPAIAFGPGVQTTVPASGLSHPDGVAVDGAGDIFIADSGNNRVVEVPAGGGTQTTVNTGSYTLNSPFGVAVDGAGDVFIADSGNNRVVEVPAGGGTQTTVNTGSYTLNSPFGVAVDGAGDVFVADSGNNRVVEVPAGGGTQTTVNTGSYTLNSPFGVAVDGAGDVFVADSGNNQVVEVPAGGGTQTTVNTGSYTLKSPFGVAVDGAGNVFIADTENNWVVEVPAGGGAQTTVGSGMDVPEAVAVDGTGDIFIADSGNNRVVEVQRSEPPSLSFDSTPVGSTSSDSPQSVTIQNIGNQRLNAVTPGLVVAGPNFLHVAGSGTPADCTSSFALTPGATCNLSISFEPQSNGRLTSTATFTDNALNASPSASQSIALQGTAGAGVLTTPTPSSTLTGSSVTFGWTAGTGASAYWLVVGSTAGGTNYYSSELSGLTATVNGLPTNGSTLYVTLYSLISGAWVPNAYTYTAFTAAAGGVITTPTPSSTLSGSSVTFDWTAGASASAYWLVVGSTAGGDNYYSSGNLGNVLTAIASGLPTNGSILYVTLYSLISGAWVPNAYTYTAFTAAAGGVITTPTPSSTLSGSSVTFDWTAGASASAYWLVVGSTAGGDNYYSSGNLGNVLTAIASGLPTNGSILYVTLYSLISGAWVPNAYTYTALNPAVITTPTPSSTLSSSSVTFDWTAGTGASAYWLVVGSTAGGDNYYSSGNLGNVLTAIASGLPTNGSILYVTLYSLISGAWVPNAYTYTAFTAAAGGVITTPTPSSTLSGSSVTFDWTAGASASAYWLVVGSTAGGDNYYSSGNLGNVLTAIASGLPTNGSILYVTLYSLIGGAWVPNVYTYTAFTAAAGGVITTPTPGSTLSGSSVTFDWTAGAGASAYWLVVGSTAGGDNYYSSGNLGNGLTAIASGLPANGSTIYVTLYSDVGGQWLGTSATYVSGP